MEAGWVVSEVGRQPWIVYDKMKVEDAATANTGVWITFIARRRSSTSGSASPTILVLRGDEPAVPRHGDGDETRPTCPYGPSEPVARPATSAGDETEVPLR